MSIDYQKVLLSATNPNLTNYEISEDVTKIAPSAFINCPQLTTVVINNSDCIKHLGDFEFLSTCIINNGDYLMANTLSNNDTFSGTVIMTNDETELRTSAFYKCSKLVGIKFPEGLTAINKHGFHTCDSLLSIIVPNTVKVITTYAFMNCSNLEYVSLPEGLETIQALTFSGCNKLTSLYIPESVTSIGGLVFSGTGLTSITLPSTRLTKGSFTLNTFGDSKLKEIKFNLNMSDAKQIIGTSNDLGYNGTIVCLDGSYETIFDGFNGGGGL